MSVFLSWAGPDRDVKNVITQKLRDAKIDYWDSDEKCVSNFSDECIAAIHDSKVFVVIISEASMSSGSYVKSEVIEARKMENEGKLNILIYKITDAPLTNEFSMQLNHVSDANNVARIYKLGKEGGIDSLMKRIKYLLKCRAEGNPEKPYDVLVPKLFGVGVNATGYFVPESRNEMLARVDEAFSESNVIILSKLFGFGKKSLIRKHVQLNKYSSAVEVQGLGADLYDFFLNNLQFTNINEAVFEKKDEHAVIQTKFEFLKKLDENHFIIISDVNIEDSCDEFIVELLKELRCRLVFVTHTSGDAYRDHFPVIDVERMESKYLLELFFHYYDRDSDLDHEPLVPALEQFFDSIGGHTKTVEIAASVLSKEMRADPDELIAYLETGTNDNRALTDRIFAKLSSLITLENFQPDVLKTLILISVIADPSVEISELYNMMHLCGINDRSAITELDNHRWITYTSYNRSVFIEPIIAQICISTRLEDYSVPTVVFQQFADQYNNIASRDIITIRHYFMKLERFFRLLGLDETAELVKVYVTECGNNPDIEKTEKACDRFDSWFDEIRSGFGEELSERETFILKTSVWAKAEIFPIIKMRGILPLVYNLRTPQSFSINNIREEVINQIYDIADEDHTIEMIDKVFGDLDEDDDQIMLLCNDILVSFSDRNINKLSKQFETLLDFIQSSDEIQENPNAADKVLIIAKLLAISLDNTGAYQVAISLFEKIITLNWPTYHMHQLLLLYATLLFKNNADDEDVLEIMMAADELLEEILGDKTLSIETRENVKIEHILKYSMFLASNGKVEEALERFDEINDLNVSSLPAVVIDLFSVINDHLMLQKRNDEAIEVITEYETIINSCLEIEGLSEKHKEKAESLLSLKEMYTESGAAQITTGGIVKNTSYYEKYSFGKKNNLITMMAYKRVANDVKKYDFSKYEEHDFAEHTKKLRERAAAGEPKMKLAAEAFALVSEVGYRVLGYRHHYVQYLGAAVMLDSKIAEILNGEGKTYTIALVAYVNSLYSDKTFVVDDSMYLTERNYKWMRGIYKILGLEVGHIQRDNAQNLFALSGTEDIIYSDVVSLGFNILARDAIFNSSHKIDLSRCSVIIDEADSLLIEQAVNSIALRSPSESRSFSYALRCKSVYNFASKIKDDERYYSKKQGAIEFKREVYPLIEDHFGINCEDLALTDSLMKFEALIKRALYTFEYVKDEDYFIKGDSIFEEDRFNGSMRRVMGERGYFLALINGINTKTYESELHEQDKYSDMIYIHGLLTRFKTICGTSATACSFAKEFKSVYGLDVIAVPPVLPVCREDKTVTLFWKKQYKDEAIVDMVAEKHENHQPVLLVVNTIRDSLYYSRLLSERGIEHNVMSAKNSEQSPELLATAGMLDSVLIATQCANRGVDIKLGGDSERMARFELIEQGFDIHSIDDILYTYPTKDMLENEMYRKYCAVLEKNRALVAVNRKKVLEKGGLCVISAEAYPDMRIEQQIRGRAGRQGAVGESYIFESLDDNCFSSIADRCRSVVIWTINKLFKQDDIPELIDSKILEKQINKLIETLHHDKYKGIDNAKEKSIRLEKSKDNFKSLIEGISNKEFDLNDLISCWALQKDNLEAVDDILNGRECSKKATTVKMLYNLYPLLFHMGVYDDLADYLYNAAKTHSDKKGWSEDIILEIFKALFSKKYSDHITFINEFEECQRYNSMKNSSEVFEKRFEEDIEEKWLEAIDALIVATPRNS